MITRAVRYEIVPPERRTTPQPGRRPAPEHASLITKAQRLRREVLAWHRAGRPWTPRAERRRRDTICKACEYANPGGNFGLGECTAPGCGCSRIKTWLATSKCPLPEPKWGALAGVLHEPRRPTAAPLQNA
jgi:hypothetical protein